MPNFEAWSYYVRGFGHLKRHTKADNAKAREFFERAASLAPGYAPVFTALGLTHFEDARFMDGASLGRSLSCELLNLRKRPRPWTTPTPMIHALWGAIYLTAKAV